MKSPREHPIVLEGQMHHAVGFGGGGLQTLEVVEVAAAHLGAERGPSCRSVS
jgi:hypothetical protein